MRKLASIQRIKEIKQIDGADNIEYVNTQGWWCIAKKGEFKVGDLAVYVEIDSLMPEREPFIFLAPRGFKVKTWKLNKFNVISQGILFPISILPSLSDTDFFDGQDVTDLIGVKKIETEVEFTPKKKLNPFVNYMMKYSFFRIFYKKLYSPEREEWPVTIPKTDETRIQNLSGIWETQWKNTSGWSITEKLEGQSLTNFLITKRRFGIFKKKVFGVCSRNIYLKTKHPCTHWNATIEQDIENKLKYVPYDVAIQSEIVGPGIQKNIYKLKRLHVFVFNVMNLSTGKKLSNLEVRNFCCDYGFSAVPAIEENATLPNKMEELIDMSNGRSLLTDTLREGLVIRREGISFKVVSPEYLVKF